MDRKVLIFTTTYNERDNVGALIDEIYRAIPYADVLVVDDDSPDGTWGVLETKRREYTTLTIVKRPGKRGIGSAHKYALIYALRENYDVVVTMDADFSHDPASIPDLIAKLRPGGFVTGSRYCEGGRSDYTGYRSIVSRGGNLAARILLNLPVRELTTYFRAFDVHSLRTIPLRYLRSSGYSYGVELVYYLRKAGIKIDEVPIHFADRLHGTSKIPKLQIFKSGLDLLTLSLQRLNPMRDLQPDVLVNDACANCGDRALAMKHFGVIGTDAKLEQESFRCTAVGGRTYPPVYTCLRCGLEQAPASQIPPALERIYENVVDVDYLANVEARRDTFKRCFDRMRAWLPERPGTMLEVGAYCGLFLKEAKNRGWDAVGVEPSRWASQHARDVQGVDVRTGFLSDKKTELSDHYDVVVSWDVLEHVRDPVGFLQECGQKLPVGGLLFFSTLDVSNWLPRLLKRRWPWLMDMHIQYFDVKSMKEVLKSAGFELIASEPYTHYGRARYIVERGSRILPAALEGLGRSVARIVPANLTIPVSFGDIKLYVARRIETEQVEAPRQEVHRVAV